MGHLFRLLVTVHTELMIGPLKPGCMQIFRIERTIVTR